MEENNFKDITIQVKLSPDHQIEKILWNATDKPADSNPETKCFSLSIWDKDQMGTLRLDMWNGEMQVEEMNRFVVETIGGMSELLINATGNEAAAKSIAEFASRLSQTLQ